MNDSQIQFKNAILRAGISPPNEIIPGKLHRFPGIGKTKGNTAGWCLLFEDLQGGCFGDWSTGQSETWFLKRNRPSTPAERAAIQKRVDDIRQHQEALREEAQKGAAEKANIIWKHSTVYLVRHYPYIKKKSIQPFHAMLYRGVLVLPIIDFSDQLTSIQFIFPNGNKRLLSSGKKKGCYIPITDIPKNPYQIIICEGWATGCTLAEQYPDSTVIAAIDAGNLIPVALGARHKWPGVDIVIAADDDRQTEGNPGLTKAREAATAADALLLVPEWPLNSPDTLSDFNDLAVWLKGGGA